MRCRDQKMICSWQEQDRILCQVLFRFLKYLIWAGKEFKVKKDFQPWFAERKAHWSEPESIRFPPNSCAHPWKFPWFQWIFMDGRKTLNSFPAHSRYFKNLKSTWHKTLSCSCQLQTIFWSLTPHLHVLIMIWNVYVSQKDGVVSGGKGNVRPFPTD